MIIIRERLLHRSAPKVLMTAGLAVSLGTACIGAPAAGPAATPPACNAAPPRIYVAGRQNWNALRDDQVGLVAVGPNGPELVTGCSVVDRTSRPVGYQVYPMGSHCVSSTASYAQLQAYAPLRPIPAGLGTDAANEYHFKATVAGRLHAPPVFRSQLQGPEPECKRVTHYVSGFERGDWSTGFTRSSSSGARLFTFGAQAGQSVEALDGARFVPIVVELAPLWAEAQQSCSTGKHTSFRNPADCVPDCAPLQKADPADPDRCVTDESQRRYGVHLEIRVSRMSVCDSDSWCDFRIRYHRDDFSVSQKDLDDNTDRTKYDTEDVYRAERLVRGFWLEVIDRDDGFNGAPDVLGQCELGIPIEDLQVAAETGRSPSRHASCSVFGVDYHVFRR